jgi:hypothetical protein
MQTINTKTEFKPTENAFLVSGLEKMVCPFAFGAHYWFAERGKHNPDQPKMVMWHAVRSAPYILGMQYALIEGELNLNKPIGQLNILIWK